MESLKKMHEKELKGAKKNYDAEVSTLKKELKRTESCVRLANTEQQEEREAKQRLEHLLKLYDQYVERLKKTHEKEIVAAKRDHEANVSTLQEELNAAHEEMAAAEASVSTLQKELKAVRKELAAASPLKAVRKELAAASPKRKSPSKRGKKMERSCLASLEPAKTRKSPRCEERKWRVAHSRSHTHK